MTDNATIRDFARTMRDYTVARNRANRAEIQEARYDRRLFGQVMSGYSTIRSQWLRRQARTADDFNLIEVLNVAEDELRHSAMLAWLLDHRTDNQGTHAQNSLGFQLLLKELDLPMDYAERKYWVRREVVGEESRVDIEVSARDSFVIHIENKVNAVEGERQTFSYKLFTPLRPRFAGIRAFSRRDQDCWE
jgi:hypothetical protein